MVPNGFVWYILVQAVKGGFLMPSPLVESLIERFRADISDGSIPATHPLPSERHLAKKYNVSRAFVRQGVAVLAKEGWINVKPNCRPTVSSRSELPVPTARATQFDHISVWLWPFIDDFAASSIFRGIRRGFSLTDLKIVVANAPEGDWRAILESERSFLAEVNSDKSCAGAIVFLLGGDESAGILKDSTHSPIPMVFLDRTPPSWLLADFVGTENVGAAQNAVRHLIALGHRRIACILNRDIVSTVSDRLEGYKRGLQESQLPYDQNLVVQPFVDQSESEEVAIDRLIVTLMAMEQPPSAIFAVNDVVALQLIDRLERLGHSVPQTISVVGFDGLLRWLPDGGFLTTADQSFVRMGELAAEMLLKRISCESPNTYRHILLDAPLRVQRSTGPPGKEVHRPHFAENKVRK